jgi:hypothetical protein
MITFLSYLATCLVLLGVYFISKPRLRGQYLIVCADSAWLIYACLTKQYALAIQSVILLTIGLSAIRNWRKSNITF